MLNWLLSAIIFIAGVWAIYRIWISAETIGKKILWTLLVAVLPVIGFVIWWFAGPKG